MEHNPLGLQPCRYRLEVWGHVNRISPISNPMIDGTAASADSRSFVTQKSSQFFAAVDK
jgi:hypothetical protein